MLISPTLALRFQHFTQGIEQFASKPLSERAILFYLCCNMSTDKQPALRSYLKHLTGYSPATGMPRVLLASLALILFVSLFEHRGLAQGCVQSRGASLGIL